MINKLYLKDAVDYLSTVTNMNKMIAEEHLTQFCINKVKFTKEPCDINKIIIDMADFLDVDTEIAKTIWYKMRFEGDVNDMCKCREDQETKYARMISHYDAELKEYKNFIDDVEKSITDILHTEDMEYQEKTNAIFSMIETKIIKFKKEHSEHSDDNPVEFENEES